MILAVPFFVYFNRRSLVKYFKRKSHVKVLVHESLDAVVSLLLSLPLHLLHCRLHLVMMMMMMVVVVVVVVVFVVVVFVVVVVVA